MLSTQVAAAAAKYTTWRSSLTAETQPGAPDIFDGDVAEEVDTAASNGVTTLMFIFGAAAFIAMVGFLLAQAATKNNYWGRIVLLAVVSVITLVPTGAYRIITGVFSTIFGI